MSDTPDFANCAPAQPVDGAAAPYTSLNYHFGMLLGVTDFETEQAYHRAKLRQHNAWQHGAGAIWGLGVTLDIARGEVQVEPGLAVDGWGRELHLDAEACLSVPAWFGAHSKDAGFTFTETATQITFDAHVVARFKACLTRQVPALAEPCDGSGTSTAYSRVFETVELLLLPGKAPARDLHYHRLRLLFGLEDPSIDTTIGKIVAADQQVLDAPKDLDSFRRFAALDEIDLQPPGDQADFSVTLADIAGIALNKAASGLTLAGGTVDQTVRPTHVSTFTIEELLVGEPGPAGGPQVKPGTVKIDEGAKTITMQVAADLSPSSVTKDAFSFTQFDEPGGWTARSISTAAYDAPSRTITLTYAGTLGGKLARLVATATGPAPILGANLVPLNNGRDFVHMQRRS